MLSAELQVAERSDDPSAGVSPPAPMSTRSIFNRFVENLVEKTAGCYGKVKDWKTF
jgi:hypothetical protein